MCRLMGWDMYALVYYTNSMGGGSPNDNLQTKMNECSVNVLYM